MTSISPMIVICHYNLSLYNYVQQDTPHVTASVHRVKSTQYRDTYKLTLTTDFSVCFPGVKLEKRYKKCILW